MASYALLNAFSGFQFDMTQGTIGFNPVQETGGEFRTFWSLDSGWGEFVKHGPSCELRLLYGKLSLQTMHLPFLAGLSVTGVSLRGKPTAFSRDGSLLRLGAGVTISAGEVLEILCG